VIGKTLAHYEIIEQIGEGGMGRVYRAHDPRLGRDVAVKVLQHHLTAAPEARARFEREARTISQLGHPHICTLHDVGRDSVPRTAMIREVLAWLERYLGETEPVPGGRERAC